MATFKNRMSDRLGFTLIEIVVTISIMAILSGIAVMSFNTLMRKNNIEAQTRDLFAVLMEARNNSFMQKVEYGVILKEKSYQMKSFVSDTDAVGTVVKSANYTYKITSKGINLPAVGEQIRFNTTGFLIGPFGATYNVDIDDTTTSLNCLVVHAARANMGKWNATTSECQFK